MNSYSYCPEIKDLSSALWKSDPDYCNPEQYGVTEDECRVYLKALEEGREKNRIWQEKYGKRMEVCCIIILWIIFAIIVWAGALYIKPYEESGSLLISVFESLWIVGPLAGTVLIIIYLICHENIKKTNKVKKAFFPKPNEKIEKLFDDYLHKRMNRERTLLQNPSSSDERNDKN